jgi:hypothetical protein
MAAGQGQEAAGSEAEGSGAVTAGGLAGRAWLAALPDEVAAQRRVIAGLVDRCQAWPMVTSLLVGPAAMAAYVTRALCREPSPS